MVDALGKTQVGRKPTSLLDVVGTFACYAEPLRAPQIAAETGLAMKTVYARIDYAQAKRLIRRTGWGLYELTRTGRRWLAINDRGVGDV